MRRRCRPPSFSAAAASYAAPNHPRYTPPMHASDRSPPISTSAMLAPDVRPRCSPRCSPPMLSSARESSVCIRARAHSCSRSCSCSRSSAAVRAAALAAAPTYGPQRGVASATPCTRGSGAGTRPHRRQGPVLGAPCLGNAHVLATMALWVPITSATSIGKVPDLVSPLKLVELQGTDQVRHLADGRVGCDRYRTIAKLQQRCEAGS